MNQKKHWEKIYKGKAPNEVSWYKPHLNLSFKLITSSAASKNSKIIDIGGGASTLVDDLLGEDYTNITALDLSAEALKVSKERLGNRASKATWIEGDIACVELPVHFYDLWHDRAVFHFLTNSEDRKKYVQNLNHFLCLEGTVIIAAFSLKGPERCSGLDVVRYSSETMGAELGKNYQLVKSLKESHETPFGTKQEFIYCVFKRGAEQKD